MDLTLYQSLDSCKNLVSEKTGLAPTDLETLLDIYAGKKGEAKVYRPYFVSAWLLSTRKTQLTAAEGAEFVDPLAVAREYLQLQRSIDLTLELTVPLGAEAVPSALVGLRTTAVSGHTDVIGHW